ncbi:MAG: tRNA (guanosine(37)-N1)-methyltransferase TrmD [Bacillota bacterium]
MRIDILTLFPGMFDSIFGESIIKRALDRELVSINAWNIRDFAYDKHRVVDDYPYGGGAGMVMKPEPLARAIAAAKAQSDAPVVYMAPQGSQLTQQKVEQLAQLPGLIVLCGHYEGIDQRVRNLLVDEEISIGDYVLTGGELAAAVLVDAVVRLLPGVLGSEQSAQDESFSHGLLEYPQYTRPPEFMGQTVPDVLLSGHHAEIAKWRRQQSLRITWERRPDLLSQAELTDEDRRFLKRLQLSD